MNAGSTGENTQGRILEISTTTSLFYNIPSIGEQHKYAITHKNDNIPDWYTDGVEVQTMDLVTTPVGTKTDHDGDQCTIFSNASTSRALDGDLFWMYM
jgi:hypothetical protein